MYLEVEICTLIWDYLESLRYFKCRQSLLEECSDLKELVKLREKGILRLSRAEELGLADILEEYSRMKNKIGEILDELATASSSSLGVGLLNHFKSDGPIRKLTLLQDFLKNHFQKYSQPNSSKVDSELNQVLKMAFQSDVHSGSTTLEKVRILHDCILDLKSKSVSKSPAKSSKPAPSISYNGASRFRKMKAAKKKENSKLYFESKIKSKTEEQFDVVRLKMGDLLQNDLNEDVVKDLIAEPIAKVINQSFPSNPLDYVERNDLLGNLLEALECIEEPLSKTLTDSNVICTPKASSPTNSSPAPQDTLDEIDKHPPNSPKLPSPSTPSTDAQNKDSFKTPSVSNLNQSRLNASFKRSKPSVSKILDTTLIRDSTTPTLCVVRSSIRSEMKSTLETPNYGSLDDNSAASKIKGLQPPHSSTPIIPSPNSAERLSSPSLNLGIKKRALDFSVCSASSSPLKKNKSASNFKISSFQKSLKSGLKSYLRKEPITVDLSKVPRIKNENKANETLHTLTTIAKSVLPTQETKVILLEGSPLFIPEKSNKLSSPSKRKSKSPKKLVNDSSSSMLSSPPKDVLSFLLSTPKKSPKIQKTPVNSPPEALSSALLTPGRNVDQLASFTPIKMDFQPLPSEDYIKLASPFKHTYIPLSAEKIKPVTPCKLDTLLGTPTRSAKKRLLIESLDTPAKEPQEEPGFTPSLRRDYSTPQTPAIDTPGLKFLNREIEKFSEDSMSPVHYSSKLKESKGARKNIGSLFKVAEEEPIKRAVSISTVSSSSSSSSSSSGSSSSGESSLTGSTKNKKENLVLESTDGISKAISFLESYPVSPKKRILDKISKTPKRAPLVRVDKRSPLKNSQQSNWEYKHDVNNSLVAQDSEEKKSPLKEPECGVSINDLFGEDNSVDSQSTISNKECKNINIEINSVDIKNIKVHSNDKRSKIDEEEKKCESNNTDTTENTLYNDLFDSGSCLDSNSVPFQAHIEKSKISEPSSKGIAVNKSLESSKKNIGGVSIESDSVPKKLNTKPSMVLLFGEDSSLSSTPPKRSKVPHNYDTRSRNKQESPESSFPKLEITETLVFFNQAPFGE